MKSLERAAIAMLCLGLWVSVGTPLMRTSIEAQRAGRRSPPQPREVRARLALLPASEDTTALAPLLRALDRDDELAEAESIWNRTVSAALTDTQRKTALQIADLRTGRRPPPMQAPELDGDVVALAAALLENYGYAEAVVPSAPGFDRWPGADRKTRSRGIEALAKEKALDPEVAHRLLAATLQFLDAQRERAANLDAIQTHMAIAMGEAPPSQTWSKDR
jgi:hypothetical protein